MTEGAQSLVSAVRCCLSPACHAMWPPPTTPALLSPGISPTPPARRPRRSRGLYRGHLPVRPAAGAPGCDAGGAAAGGAGGAAPARQLCSGEAAGRATLPHGAGCRFAARLRRAAVEHLPCLGVRGACRGDAHPHALLYQGHDAFAHRPPPAARPGSPQEWGVDLSEHQQPSAATLAYVGWLQSVAQDPKQVGTGRVVRPALTAWPAARVLPAPHAGAAAAGTARPMHPPAAAALQRCSTPV